MSAPIDDEADDADAERKRSWPSSSEPSESKSRNEMSLSVARRFGTAMGAASTGDWDRDCDCGWVREKRCNAGIERETRRGVRFFGPLIAPKSLLDWRPNPLLSTDVEEATERPDSNESRHPDSTDREFSLGTGEDEGLIPRKAISSSKDCRESMIGDSAFRREWSPFVSLEGAGLRDLLPHRVLLNMTGCELWGTGHRE